MARTPAPSASPASAPPAAAPAVAAPAVAAPAPSAPVAVAPKAAPVVTSSKELPSAPTAEQVAAEMAFFKVEPEEGTAQVVKEPVKTPVKEEVREGGEEPLIPAYADPETRAADEGGAEDTFSLPAWVASVPAESRAEAEKTVRNLYEQTQKLKRQRGEAVDKQTTAEKERDAEKAAREELAKAPTAVAAPELALPNLRTKAEVSAMLEKAPELRKEKQAVIDNCLDLLNALREKAEAGEEQKVEMFGRTYTAADIPAIKQYGGQISAELQQIDADVAAAPKRLAWLDERHTTQKEAEKWFPDLYKSDTAMAKAREALVKKRPLLDALPESPLIIGDHLMMNMVRAGKHKLVPVNPKAQTAAATNAPPTAQSRESAAPTPRPAAASTEAEYEELRAAASKGDRKAQARLEELFFKVPA